ncbi:AKT-interacting protein [Trichoplax sp. H2]|nr:AKT-interacting protein [Trichoplax sp. H2]|eukprot:RDD47232.1 AKT-interacting protein [Trichoplax sp. H2]
MSFNNRNLTESHLKDGDRKETIPQAADVADTSTQIHGPFFIEQMLLFEYKELSKHNLTGVFVLPSAHNPLCWHGVVFVRHGVYIEGVFKFDILIPQNFPYGNCPKIIFTNPIYHPDVNPETGELYLKKSFPEWSPRNHLYQILLHIKQIFYRVNTENAVNSEAAYLYESEFHRFKQKVAQSIEKGRRRLFDNDSDDPHAIKFKKWDPNVHEVALKSLLANKKEILKAGILSRNS